MIEGNYAGAAAIKDAPAEIPSAATLAALDDLGSPITAASVSARRDRDAEHAGQRMPAAAVVAWVGELGDVVEQAAALRAGQRDGRGHVSGGGDGR